MLNRDNFLQWSGALDAQPFYNVAANKSVALQTGLDYVDVDVLAGSSATYGIDTTTIFATQSAPGLAPRWSAKLQRLRIFRPTGAPAAITVEWGFRDYKGNASNAGQIILDLTILATAWRVHLPSVYCLKSPYNANTGYKGYSLLQLYYTASGAVYSPLTTKPNAPSDPDYVAPVVDVSACPLPSIAQFIVKNQSGSAGLRITRVRFQINPTPGSSDFEFASLAIDTGTSQTFNVPTGVYAQIIVYHTQLTTPTGKFIDYSPGNASTTTQALSTVNGGSNQFVNAAHIQPGSTMLLY